MYRFEVGGCEQVFIKTASCLDNDILLVTSVPLFNPDMVGKLPPNVTLLDHRDIPLLNRMRWLLSKPYGAVLYSFVSMAVLPVYLKCRFRGEKAQFVNFSDTLSSLFIAVRASAGGSAISWIQCRPQALKNSKGYRYYIRLLKRCRRLVNICQSQKKELMESGCFPDAGSNEVIYNPVDIEEIHEKMKLPVDTVERYICLVSRLDEKSKDFYTPLAAYSSLPADITDKVRLYIVGDGPDRWKIEGYVESLALKDKVRFVGTDVNPFRWIGKSDLFVFSSKSEGLGMVILEAMACGKYVVATDCPVGPAEIITGGDSVCGAVVPVGDVEKMRDAILWYYTHPEEAEECVNNAGLRLRDFSIARFRESLDKLFNRNLK